MQKSIICKATKFDDLSGLGSEFAQYTLPHHQRGGPPDPSVLTCTISIFQCTTEFYSIYLVFWQQPGITSAPL